MNRDQAIGALIMVVSIAVLVFYFWLVFLSPTPWQLLTIQITAFLGVGLILAILAWIGYTLATTPAPEPLPELTQETKSEQESEKKE
ncbi:MAG: transcriptional regulator [Candidatus Terraquivivens tikiterensis]|uniref:Transcriptional regulator n=1 Tax=Candidatus Terraquivivens tikiterensis TaxID=1980982 RepID=A0A2R7Y881_9ARCH|nr:MAG: transcriptional regulator [Candidatus Terraquivivens tikiterensis]